MTIHPQSTALNQRPHLQAIDGLRACCALWVLLFHASVGHLFWTRQLPTPVRWVAWGHFAVPAFIVISGFCLMLPVLRKGALGTSAPTFYVRRLRRILPPYYAALVLFAVMSHVSKRNIALHLLLVHNLKPQYFYGINPSFWSLAVECQIYLLFPAIVYAWYKWGRKATALSAFLIAYILNFALQDTTYWGLCLHYTGLFMIGASAAWIAFHPSQEHRRDKINWLVVSASIAGVAWMVTILYGHPPHNVANDVGWISGLQISVYNLFVACMIACILISTTTTHSRLRAVLSWQPLVWLGGFSYSLYLLHHPILGRFEDYISHHHIDNTGERLCVFGVAFACIVLSSYLFYWFFERPFLSAASKARPDRQ